MMLGDPHMRRTMFLCNFVHFGGHSGFDVSPQLVKGAKWQAQLGESPLVIGGKVKGVCQGVPIIGGKVKGVCQWCG